MSFKNKKNKYFKFNFQISEQFSIFTFNIQMHVTKQTQAKTTPLYILRNFAKFWLILIFTCRRPFSIAKCPKPHKTPSLHDLFPLSIYIFPFVALKIVDVFLIFFMFLSISLRTYQTLISLWSNISPRKVN